MFTGLIEEIGKIKGIKKGASSIALSVEASQIMDDVKIGDSIATNGVCLTVVSFDKSGFTADVMPETMNRTAFAELKSGSSVNLERAMRLGDRMGGHMVSGHIDGVGQVVENRLDDNAIWISIAAPAEVLKYVIQKGSIAIDGISLTVAYVDDNMFKVSIIPLTQDETTLTSKKVGSVVNLECDLTAKYIEKFLFNKEVDQEKNNKSNISMNFLKENGFA